MSSPPILERNSAWSMSFPCSRYFLGTRTYAFKVPEYEQMLHADAEERLNELIGEVTTPGTNIRTIVGRGDAASEIVRIAEKENVDVIVIATHGMTGWRRVVFGSVAERVVRLAKCPVLTTRVSQAEP